MFCPKCGGKSTVVDKSDVGVDEIYRRRKCLVCGASFYTTEFIVERNEEYKTAWNNNYRNNFYKTKKKGATE